MRWSPRKRAREAFFDFLINLIGIFVLIFLVLNILRSLFIPPVIRIAAIVDAFSLGKAHAETHIKPAKHEISSQWQMPRS